VNITTSRLPTNTSHNIIEVFADIWCPFAYIGLRMIRDYRDSLGANDTHILVRSWPLELINEEPMNPEKAYNNCSALRDQVAPDAFAGINVEQFPVSTLDALTLIARAYEVDLSLGEAASFKVRDALFEEGKDISDTDVLDKLAEDLGIPHFHDPTYSAVHADWEEGKRRGVIGSPHFFHGTVGTFCPSLQMSKSPEAGLTIHTDTSRLQDFLQQCFMPGGAIPPK
jgi:2-hydroxychromene-2-carboxylate isomerase